MVSVRREFGVIFGKSVDGQFMVLVTKMIAVINGAIGAYQNSKYNGAPSSWVILDTN